MLLLVGCLIFRIEGANLSHVNVHRARVIKFIDLCEFYEVCNLAHDVPFVVVSVSYK